MLAFVIHREIPCDELAENYFPTPNRLRDLVRDSSLQIQEWLGTAALPSIPEEWNQRVGTVTSELADRHGHTRAWQLAEDQSSKIGRLLGDGTLTGELLVLRHA